MQKCKALTWIGNEIPNPDSHSINSCCILVSGKHNKSYMTVIRWQDKNFLDYKVNKVPDACFEDFSSNHFSAALLWPMILNHDFKELFNTFFTK